MKVIAQTATNWKRKIMQAYDVSGIEHPKAEVRIPMGRYFLTISLDNFDSVDAIEDTSIEEYINQEILISNAYKVYSVNGVESMKYGDCKINIYEDYDIKDTLFGGIKEVNHRYAYVLNLYDFETAAQKVCDECVASFEQSNFLKEYVNFIKKYFIQKLQRISEVQYEGVFEGRRYSKFSDVWNIYKNMPDGEEREELRDQLSQMVWWPHNSEDEDVDMFFLELRRDSYLKEPKNMQDFFLDELDEWNQEKIKEIDF